MIIETALAAPMALLLVMGLLDFSLYLLRQDTMASAARDGARKAILKPAGADVGPQTSCSSGASANFTTICTATKARLAGSPVRSVQVACYVGTTSTPKSCGTADPDTDTVEVTVVWGFTPSTPVGRTFIGTRNGMTSAARMIVQ